MWKGTAVHYFNIINLKLLREAKENHENLSQYQEFQNIKASGSEK
jgi:hypothetical protein